MICDNCHAPMIVRDRFRFDHEADDTPRMRAQLERFQSMGIQLGAACTIWACPECSPQDVSVTFEYPEPHHE